MKLAEARALDEQGKLRRKVLTEEGWYIPRQPPVVSPPPLILPPERKRKKKG